MHWVRGLQPNSAQTVIFPESGCWSKPGYHSWYRLRLCDIIFSLIGADYVTINGIDLTANHKCYRGRNDRNRVCFAEMQRNRWCTKQHNRKILQSRLIKQIQTVAQYLRCFSGCSTCSNCYNCYMGANSFNIFRNNTATNTNSGILMLGYNDVTPFAFLRSE